MNHYVLALGSNQGERLDFLNQASRRLAELGTLTSMAPALENPPWLPTGAPSSWYKFFLNSAVILESTLTPLELLSATQKIEADLGRPADHPDWSPRTIDIDLLFELHGTRTEHERLKLPHPQWQKRNFVLAPLSHILPEYKNEAGESILSLYRRESKKLASLMAIVNVTPDSFSNTDPEISYENIFKTIYKAFQMGAAYVDIGAESTRPGARALTSDEEWLRLKPVLSLCKELKIQSPFTKISVDTYHPATARRALDYGVDILNDVRGFQDPEMRELAVHFKNIVVMHSLSVPADKNNTWPEDTDVVQELTHWLESKLETLKHLQTAQILWDPGFGFGKTALQNQEIIKNFWRFKKLPVRSVVGHSRKSFMNLWSQKDFKDRDTETLALSSLLLQQGADILRVHNIEAHNEFFKAHMACETEYA